MKTTKRSFLTSLVALLVLFSMFVGTTFAWFTDIAVSSGNVIQAGKLDISLKSGAPVFNDAGEVESWNWTNTEGKAIFNYDKWEPGYTTWAALAVENNGNLAAKISARISLNGNPTILGDVIDVYAYVADFEEFDPNARPDFTSKAWHSIGTVNEIFEGTATVLEDRLLNPNVRARIIIALHMREDAGNEYQGLDLGSNFDITIMATQASKEPDSFDEKYDENAEWPFVPIKFNASESIADKIDPTNGGLTEPVTVGDEGGIKAEVPADVTLAEGATSLTLSVETKDESEANIETTSRDQVVIPLDVHMDGVHPDNKTPITVNLPGYAPTGLNGNNIKLYHVEKNGTNEMTLVDTPVNHNEYSYDPSNGNVVITIASFSEIATYAETDAAWDGTSVETYTESGNTITIYNAAQFAYFRNQVDAGNSFEGKTVKLAADINLNNHNFDPIGWGYEYAEYNRKDADGNRIPGKVFKGIFDGGIYDSEGNVIGTYTIKNLLQSGWGLESSTNTDYTYTNCGGGLFASACDATFRNLTISNASIVFECVEIGILVGLAQGDCNFENVNIYGSKIANYQRPAGGVVGEVSPAYDETKGWYGTHSFTNVTLGANTVVGSLWGDFDAPVGGVIGARWDDYDVTKVSMTNCDIACRLDVYSDVTSTYKWYNYRRAGMLIGNTDTPPADGKNSKVATADFLECSGVTVRYGTWANYHYCQFSNYNTSWPFVRVEAGENCSAFANPRWGVAYDVNGNKVTPETHNTKDTTGRIHKTGDSCMIEIPFGQLYGGGQGVKGGGQDENYTSTHAGVTIIKYDYTVSYVNNYETLKQDFVSKGETYTVSFEPNPTINGETITKWEDAGTHEYTSGSSTITIKDDVVLYPVFATVFEIRFMGADNLCYYYEAFKSSDSSNTLSQEGQKIINQVLLDAKNSLDASERDNYEVTWVAATDSSLFTYGENSSTIKKSNQSDIVVHLTYTYTGSAKLNPVDSDSDGDIDYYEVTGVEANTKNIVIPAYVNGLPVITVTQGAFDGYDDLYAVRIPATVTTLSQSIFPGSAGNRQTVTIYYEGTVAQWEAMNKINDTQDNGFLADKDYSWDDYLGTGTRVFFLDANGKVDESAGYFEVYGTSGYGILDTTDTLWAFHKHSYEETHDNTCSSSSFNGEYTDYDAAGRPDIAYWTWVVSYDANYDGAVAIDPAYVVYGATINDYLPTEPTRDGYEFDGWYTAASGGTEVDTTYVPTSDITLYAHWTEK